MYGSANYGWCLADLPEGIILQGISNEPANVGSAPVIQNFYFAAIGYQQFNVDIHFVLDDMSDPTIIVDRFSAHIIVVPSNANNFVPYSENESGTAISNEAAYRDKTFMAYGYPCGVQEANLKYGYPCGRQGANLKYGYPGCH